MIDFAAVLSALKLGEFAIGKLKGRMTKKEKQQLVAQAEKLIAVATDGDIDKYVVQPRVEEIDKRIGQSWPAIHGRVRKSSKSRSTKAGRFVQVSKKPSTRRGVTVSSKKKASSARRRS